jgi:hypothetical protein
MLFHFPSRIASRYRPADFLPLSFSGRQYEKKEQFEQRLSNSGLGVIRALKSA